MHNLRRLAVLLAVVDSGSFTAAADNLQVSQPSISQAISRLERETGLQLVVRDRAGVVPTQAGAILVEHARRMVDQSLLATAQLAQLVPDRRRPLRIGAFGSAMTTLLPGVLGHLAADGLRHVPIEAYEAAVDQLVAGVASGRLDAAIGYDDVDRPADTLSLVRTELFDEPLEVAIGPRHPAAQQVAIGLADLAEERWLTPSSDHLLVRACRAAGFEPRVAAQARDVLAIRSLIVATGVVTLTPALLRRDLRPVVTRPLLSPVERRVFAVTAEPLTRQSQRLLSAMIASTEQHGHRGAQKS